MGTFYCTKCKKQIDGHHQYCHDSMCEDCFNETYFPEDQKAYIKRLIILENGKKIDPVMQNQESFEKELNLTKYIETKDNKENRLYVDAFFLFLKKLDSKKLIAFMTHDEEIVKAFEWDFATIKKNLYLESEGKGPLSTGDMLVSQAFTDAASYYAIVQQGIIFFSGNENAAKLMKEALDELDIKYIPEEISDFSS